jgi:hypothetical protein
MEEPDDTIFEEQEPEKYPHLYEIRDVDMVGAYISTDYGKFSEDIAEVEQIIVWWDRNMEGVEYE